MPPFQLVPTSHRPWRAAAPRRPLQPRCQAGPNSDATSDASREAVLARIQRAKQYKTSQQQQPVTEGPVQLATGGGSSAGAGVARTSVRPAAATVLGQQAAPPVKPSLPPQQPDTQVVSGQQGSGGSEQQAAGWLQSVVTKEAEIDPNMSLELFTLMKEEEMKRRGGEVIVGSFKPITRKDRMEPEPAAAAAAADVMQQQDEQPAGGRAAAGSQAAGAVAEPPAQQQEQEQQQQEGQEGEDPKYKPKVATWGVFPRPQNISEAYGGGRNLRPGQALESEEERKEREARVNAALKRYRKALGTEVDPREEARAQVLYDEGAALFKQGAIALALEKYAAAAALVPTRCRVGGEARLQQAICLDSLGKNDEAYEIYKTIKRHPNAAVAKQANRMLFGFKAAESLKTASMSYAPPSAAWQSYFDRISRGSWTASIYSKNQPTGEEVEVDDRWVTAVALGVMLAPLALVAYRVLLVR